MTPWILNWLVLSIDYSFVKRLSEHSEEANSLGIIPVTYFATLINLLK
jgi:hypothetical protein